MYNLVRKALFSLDAERAHHLTLTSLPALAALGVPRLFQGKVSPAPLKLFDYEFSNPVGLAAGLDKNGDYVDALAAFGFGFIEVGTVTPRPQPGNPKPRLFRLTSAQAIINRMGFNNKGVDHLVSRLARRRWKGVLGVNIGKNFDTPLEKANEDYLVCLRKVYGVADYIVLNISSPNTKGLRTLQEDDSLRRLLEVVCRERDILAGSGTPKPIVIKIAPDLDLEQLESVARIAREGLMNGIIATNTTTARMGVEGLPHAEEQGGLSGAPLHQRSLTIVRTLRKLLPPQFPLIGVGGIMSAENGAAMIEAGASLIQIYTGFVYRGPSLVAELINATQGSRARASF